MYEEPERCAYCEEAVAVVVCGLEHGAWIGQALCRRCYLEVLAEPPVLPGRSPLAVASLDPLEAQ